MKYLEVLFKFSKKIEELVSLRVQVYKVKTGRQVDINSLKR